MADSSLAESIAPLIRIPGPWLRWTVADRPSPAPGPPIGHEGFLGDEELVDAVGPLERPGDPEERPRGGILGHPYSVEEPSYADAAVRMVQGAVDEISAFHDVSAEEAVPTVSPQGTGQEDRVDDVPRGLLHASPRSGPLTGWLLHSPYRMLAGDLYPRSPSVNVHPAHVGVAVRRQGWCAAQAGRGNPGFKDDARSER